MKPAKPLTLELLNKYFEKLVAEKYYGIIELTLQGGEIAHTVERHSKPAFEIAADIFRESDDEELKSRIVDKFDNTDGKFRRRAGVEKSEKIP